MPEILGIDGAGSGWVGVALDTESGALSAHFLQTEEIATFDCSLIAIDIPIGLSDRGQRAADVEARRLLGRPRGSSVFPTPIRSALNASTWEEACGITLAVDGRRVAMQTFAIMNKIAAVDELLQRDPQLSLRTFEVHPEVSFAHWAGSPMVHGKKRHAGRQERQELIAANFGQATFQDLHRELKSKVEADDLADAFAALWTAIRIHEKTAAALPDRPVFDSTGLSMRIWY